MGAGEEAKGKIKQVVGEITDNDTLEEEGRAQKGKGRAEREAAQDLAKAKAHEAKAKEKEMERDLAGND